MTTAFQSKIEALEQLEADFDSIILDLVRDNEKAVLKMNVDDQLYEQGIDSNGQKLSPPYAPATVRRKRRRGNPYDRVTTREEGDFHDSFFIKYGDDEFEIGSNENHATWVERRYGKEIYGLTEENIGFLQNLIRPHLIEVMRRRLNAA